MNTSRRAALVVPFLLAAAWSLPVRPVIANHPVLVEGNNGANGAPGTTTVPPGTAGDFDGDGLVGAAEDTDNATDRLFGTITAALLGTNGGANANGRVTIVTSGRFGEAIRIPNVDAGQAAINGVTILEAAPGVSADIDAVLAGDAGNAGRVAAPGIVVDTLAIDRTVTLRNLTIRNFTVGLLVKGNARVIVEKCRFDSNIERNVLVMNNARVTMTDCTIVSGGHRFGTGGGPPAPGDGITFLNTASGSLQRCTISGNSAAGIRNGGTGFVQAVGCNLFDNSPNTFGLVKNLFGFG